MLEVQKYLKGGKSLEQLKDEIGIKASHHPELPLVILNYDQIESPKTHPIVRECRALVLRSDTYDFVSRGFPRFFNWGEVADEMPHFDFSNFHVDSKEDGSLAIIFPYEDRWHVMTRGSWADQPVQEGIMTWTELMYQALGVSGDDELNSILDKKYIYVCELVSPYNKVVRYYSEPKMYLLTMFHRDGTEASSKKTDAEHERTGLFLRPDRYDFSNIDEIIEFLHKQGEEDQTFEGVVIRDVENRRWKIKNPTYLSLHKMRGDGDNLFMPKYLIPFVLSGEDGELLAIFPEVTERYNEVKSKVNAAWDEVLAVWEKHWQIENQKEFALAIKASGTKFTGLLFSYRKMAGENQTAEGLRKIWLHSSADMILKILF